MILTVQYLEPGLHLARLDPDDVSQRLTKACRRAPITHVIVGWDIPAHLQQACREQAAQLGTRFLRWQPLLTGDGVLKPLREWRVVGLDGQPVPAWQEKPEFTFLCPNNPGVQHAVQDRIGQLVQAGGYDGFFLDRVRLPSPTVHPAQEFGCFCEHCRQKASDQGLDLSVVRKSVNGMLQSEEGRLEWMRTVLAGGRTPAATGDASLLKRFLLFRAGSITRFVHMIAADMQRSGLEVGLDCFAPSLAGMVGQDMAALGKVAAWIKGMTYARTLAPAGLPFELQALASFLIAQGGLDEGQALAEIGKALHMRLPADLAGLRRDGINAQDLAGEVARGITWSGAPFLAGIELVDLPGATQLTREKVEEDVRAVARVGPAGLALSWDLLHIPLERLEWISPYADIKPVQTSCN
jgi:hypothetical protein